MKKEELLKDVGKLTHDINYWTGELTTARINRNEDGIRNAHWAMESLMVAAHQELLFLAEQIGEMHDDFDLEEVYKNVDEVQYQRGYEKGRREILKELQSTVMSESFDCTVDGILLWIEKKEDEI